MMDSLKLPDVRATGVLMSPIDILTSRVSCRETVVLLRSVTVHPTVPLMSTVEGIIAAIGHTMMSLEVETPMIPQDWRDDIEADSW